MATVIPPLSKRQRREAQLPSADALAPPADLPQVRVRFQAFDTGEFLPADIRIKGDATTVQLEQLLNELNGSSDDPTPYEFALARPDGAVPVEIASDLYSDVLRPKVASAEEVLTLVYTPRAVFRVRAMTRTTGAGVGHGATILAAQFAPHNSARCVTGAGDSTARIWNADSQTPLKTLAGHTGSVLAVAWSPDGRFIATGGHDGLVNVWDGLTGERICKTLAGHGKYITSLAWEPLHLTKTGVSRLASASKDGTARVWQVDNGTCQYALNGHKGTVSCIKWGGFGDIYTGSHDKTIKVWSAESGRLTSTLQAHGHWVNHLALSTEYVIRTGPYDEMRKDRLPAYPATSLEKLRERARERFDAAVKQNAQPRERLCSASDDFTMFLWEPAKQTKPLARMTGHQKPVNHVAFSPDGRSLASASFDNSVKLWDGQTGKFVASLRGHVAAVYQCAWSADSRLLVSSSKDTTLKIWDIKSRKLKTDLPGHQDEVFAVDWSPDGERVCSGGKDKTIRFWSH